MELTLQSLSPAVALYDPLGVDVPLNCDIINQSMEFLSLLLQIGPSTLALGFAFGAFYHV